MYKDVYLKQVVIIITLKFMKPGTTYQSTLKFSSGKTNLKLYIRPMNSVANLKSSAKNNPYLRIQSMNK